MKCGSTLLLKGAKVVLLAAITITLLSFGGWGFALAWAASGTQAIKASDFLDSLGAVTHVIQGIDSVTGVQEASSISASAISGTTAPLTGN